MALAVLARDFANSSVSCENLPATERRRSSSSAGGKRAGGRIVLYSSRMRLVVYIGLHNQSSSSSCCPPARPASLSPTFAFSPSLSRLLARSLALPRPHIREFLIARLSLRHPCRRPCLRAASARRSERSRMSRCSRSRRNRNSAQQFFAD